MYGVLLVWCMMWCVVVYGVVWCDVVYSVVQAFCDVWCGICV